MTWVNYEKLSKLGEGTYGAVFKGRDRRTGQEVAIKCIKLEQEEEGIPPTSIREISILKELNHPNIVKLIEVINSQGELTLVFEYLHYDMRKFLDRRSKQRSPLPPMIVKSYAYQIIAGLCYCHCHRIIHRDMKPQNLLMDESGKFVKICDFGLARAFTVPLRDYTHEVVTLWYRAPEILLGSKFYSLPIDIWSTGCIIAEMITMHPLFPGDAEIDQLFKIFKVLGTPTEENFPDVTQLPAYSATFPKWTPKNLADVIPGAEPLALDLIAQMLRYDPAARISAKAALDHPWFSDLPEQAKAACRPVEIEPIA